MKDYVKSNALAIIAALLAIAALTVSFSIDTTDDGKGNKSTKITFRVDKSTAPGTQSKAIPVSAPVVAAVDANLEEKLKVETPIGAPPEQLLAQQQLEAEVKATLPPLPTAGASGGVPGCRTQFVINQSSRRGVHPIWFVLHYTVSPNVTGWGDVNAVTALFNRSSSQASSHFILDAEGHCAYIVPIEAKSWTQAAGNPLSVSVELIATGRESTLCAGPCLTQLRTIYKTVAARVGIPARQGSVYPGVAGCVQHKDGGLAWGGHIDVTPFNSRQLCSRLLASQPVSKQAKWVAHRKAIHVTYSKKCKHKYQRQRRPVTCAKLRSDARKLDTLIKREAKKA